MIEIRIDTEKTIDRETLITAKATADNTLLILDLRKITSEIDHKALRTEIGAIAADPTIVDPRTLRTVQGYDHMIETITEQQDIMSQTVQDRIIEEVSVLIRFLEITVENVIQTKFNSEITNSTDYSWTIKK